MARRSRLVSKSYGRPNEPVHAVLVAEGDKAISSWTNETRSYIRMAGTGLVGLGF
jgi:hypothetical protein